jgi:hypothetical protein
MILIEENFHDVTTDIVVESATNTKKMYLSGVFAEAGVKNRNGRTYRLNELTKEVERINSLAAQGQFVLGELDHPNSLEVKLENVSHKIVSARMEGNRMIGKAEILDKHPKGAILKALIDSDIRVGVSTRGSGSVMESTGEVSNFHLVTVDAVATPSCRSAYPETIQEQLEMYARGEIINDLSESVIHDSAAQKYLLAEMQKFIAHIKTSHASK